MTSLLDSIYSRFSSRNAFFQKGWGDHSSLGYLLATEPSDIHLRPVKEISVNWQREKQEKGLLVRSGNFTSPFEFTYEIGKERTIITLPQESQKASVLKVLPKEYTLETPIAIHFAATGDQGFTRRKHSLAIPLARQGIGSIILENPFYGIRRPQGQKGDSLEDFTSFLRMSRAATDEGIALIHYLRQTIGFTTLGVTGVSMGGYIALTVAARCNTELATAACIPCHSASPVYVDGLLSRACAWQDLQEELPPEKDARKYMRQILEMSDIRNFPLPLCPQAAVIVGAKKDGYIPNFSTHIIHKYWSGSTLRWINTGHVGSFLFHRKDFQQAIIDSFRALKKHQE
ncbi:MAG: alpha/beta hydrolase family protein [Spirochaetota bacterium]